MPRAPRSRSPVASSSPISRPTAGRPRCAVKPASGRSRRATTSSCAPTCSSTCGTGCGCSRGCGRCSRRAASCCCRCRTSPTPRSSRVSSTIVSNTAARACSTRRICISTRGDRSRRRCATPASPSAPGTRPTSRPTRANSGPASRRWRRRCARRWVRGRGTRPTSGWCARRRASWTSRRHRRCSRAASACRCACCTRRGARSTRSNAPRAGSSVRTAEPRRWSSRFRAARVRCACCLPTASGW